MPTVADLLADVCAEFARDGALGVLYVDCAALDEVERRYGEEAHVRTLASVADVVSGACVEVLGEREPLARGETGRSELICFITRKPGDVDFHAKLLAGAGARGARATGAELPACRLPVPAPDSRAPDRLRVHAAQPDPVAD